MSKSVGTHIYKYLKFSLKNHGRLVFEEPGSCVCWLIWKMFIYFKMPEGPQDDYFFGKQSTIDPCDGQELAGSPCWDWVKLKYIYIRHIDIEVKLYLQNIFFSPHENEFGTAVEVIFGTTITLETSKVSRLHPYRWRLTSFIVWSPRGCHQDTGVVMGVVLLRCPDGETQPPQPPVVLCCGWCYIALFLVFVWWWVFWCVVLFTPLGEVLMTCVCVCFFPLPWHL